MYGFNHRLNNRCDKEKKLEERELKTFDEQITS